MKDEYLEVTLAKLDVGIIGAESVQVIASSAPNREQNAEVYNRCNELVLGELRKQSLGQIYHVTGEMRAVADPKHREVCRLASRKYDTPPIMMANLPREGRRNGRDLWKWNTEKWPPQAWQNHLDAFHLFSSHETLLNGLEAPAPMHFSLFGEQFVLLQEEHDHNIHTKRVWLIKSDRLRDALASKVEKSLRNSMEISSRLFQNFAALLSDPLHLHVLSQSAEGKRNGGEAIQKMCESFGSSASEVLADLYTAGFVVADNENTTITKPGTEFLSLFVKNE